ncbi:hypothetical protein [Aquabacter cavernae]|uniref:hypothetical protein n=1 Tax=Aquabacter cavernae TaxID=2496029 RepID=UPI000F8DA462|nr:hypothetical protein [Aquabacter cavernae]
MIKLTPSLDSAVETIEILRDFADTFASVLGSPDRELLSHEGTRSGFMYIAMGMSRSLTELERLVEREMTAARATERERDALVEELHRLRRHEAGRDAPDLSEPAPPERGRGTAAAAG